MSGPNFTPGPWRTNLGRVERAITIYHQPHGLGDVALVYGSVDDARLISKSPELFAVLEEAIEREYNPFEPDNQSHRYKRLVALRREITGEAG